jgi:predicted peptidase
MTDAPLLDTRVDRVAMGNAQRLPHYEYLVDGLPPAGERKPLLLFLHGKGERGRDLGKVRAQGPPQLFPRYGLDRFVLVSPQCPDDRKWEAAHLDEFLDAFCKAWPVDAERTYLTGLSLGGEGGFHLLARRPERFAASILICGRTDLKAVGRLPRFTRPIWLVHSAGDEVVPVAHSDAVFDALRTMRAPVTYTRYDTPGHVATWQKAYSSTMLFDWLLEHRRA